MLMVDGMNSRNQKAVHFEEGSGNIFADLYLRDFAGLYTRIVRKQVRICCPFGRPTNGIVSCSRNDSGNRQGAKDGVGY